MLRRSLLAATAMALALPAAAQDNTIRVLAPTWVGFANGTLVATWEPELED